MNLKDLSITELKATAFDLQYSLNQVMVELQSRNPAPQVEEVTK
jgi:hypothetical protein